MIIFSKIIGTAIYQLPPFKRQWDGSLSRLKNIYLPYCIAINGEKNWSFSILLHLNTNTTKGLGNPSFF